MAIASKCIDFIRELEGIVLNNKECFYYEVFNCKQGKSILKIDAKDNKYELEDKWSEERVLQDIKKRISNECIKTFNISRISHINDIVFLDIFIHAEYECNIGGETHLDIYIKMDWDKKRKKVIV